MKEPIKSILMIFSGLMIAGTITAIYTKPEKPIYMSIPENTLVLKRGDTITAGVGGDRIDVVSKGYKSNNLKLIIIK